MFSIAKYPTAVVMFEFACSSQHCISRRKWTRIIIIRFCGILKGSPTAKLLLRHPFVNIVDLRQTEPTVDFNCSLVTHEGRWFNIYTRRKKTCWYLLQCWNGYWNDWWSAKSFVRYKSVRGYSYIEANTGTYSLAAAILESRYSPLSQNQWYRSQETSQIAWLFFTTSHEDQRSNLVST